jgi:hypothetical protein
LSPLLFVDAASFVDGCHETRLCEYLYVSKMTHMNQAGLGL